MSKSMVISGGIIARKSVKLSSTAALGGRPKSKMSLRQVLDGIAKSIFPTGQSYMLKDVMSLCFQFCEVHGKTQRIKTDTQA